MQAAARKKTSPPANFLLFVTPAERNSNCASESRSGIASPARHHGWRADCGQCRDARLPQITGQTQDFQRGINLEQQWLVLPVKKMRVCSNAQVRMLSAIVILKRRIEVAICAQRTNPFFWRNSRATTSRRDAAHPLSSSMTASRNPKLCRPSSLSATTNFGVKIQSLLTDHRHRFVRWKVMPIVFKYE